MNGITEKIIPVSFALNCNAFLFLWTCQKQFQNLSVFAGSILGGVLLDFTTAESRYKLGIAVEAKAMEMYSEFIKMSQGKDPDLCKRLWLNRIDEELHLLWYKDNLNKAKSQDNLA